jgi:hypothetical protein
VTIHLTITSSALDGAQARPALAADQVASSAASPWSEVQRTAKSGYGHRHCAGAGRNDDAARSSGQYPPAQGFSEGLCPGRTWWRFWKTIKRNQKFSLKNNAASHEIKSCKQPPQLLEMNSDEMVPLSLKTIKKIIKKINRPEQGGTR